ncbi:PREDICTED: protein hu-li tai shao-like [Priapulus caudatus]|uniref:Protein hu-li tai shao-like n=1 Tax=Priapulus caudatus TaxID=37621 RepID=A0ABM1EY57_PRICU|nr:PREDICTED: protein hu-li tai shao-like [Priapulus caudatus]
MRCGLLPICQEAMICGEITYHDYQGILINPDEKEQIRNDLGQTSKVMFLRNHGFVTLGETIEEAWYYAWNCMIACETQARAVTAGLDNIIQPSADVVQKVNEVGRQGGGGVNSNQDSIKWRPGQLEFEAHMRWMDATGYRTGYVYRQPVVRVERIRKGFEDVEVPPSASSFRYIFDDEDGSLDSSLKQAMELRKQGERNKWMNTPSSYEKVEFEETGTPNPKKITKWKEVGEGDSDSTARGTPFKMDINQFVPRDTDPREFKKLQSTLKSERLKGTITSGPQSKILEGTTWEEVQRMQDGTLSGADDKVIAFGAASKGIIERDQQHNVQVYRQYYAANPFDNITDDDIAKYKADIERRERAGRERAPPSPPPRAVAPPQRAVTPPPDLQRERPASDRWQDERKTPQQSDAQFRRAKSAREPRQKKREPEVNGDAEDKTATMRSTDSGELESSPSKTPGSKEKKKKKKGFHTPSFLKGKKKDKHKE